jgi:hypothetical protein
MASVANDEQLGSKRQDTASAGLSTMRYAEMSTLSVRATASSAGGNELQRWFELGGRLGIREVVGTRLGDHDDVGSGA